MDKKSTPFNKDKPTLLGINAITEAFKQPKVQIETLYVLKTYQNPRIDSVLEEAKKRKIPFSFQGDSFFNQFEKQNHQGLAASLEERIPVFEDMQSVEAYLETKNDAVVLALDRITDPHNLGAISRSAYFFGVNLILMEKKDSAPLNATVHKVSSGASLLMNYAVIGSLRLSLDHLRNLGFNIYAAEADPSSSQAIDQIHFEKPLCLLMGSEGKGIRKNLIAREDKKIHIQGKTNFDSLNVSVATSIILHAITKQ